MWRPPSGGHALAYDVPARGRALDSIPPSEFSVRFYRGKKGLEKVINASLLPTVLGQIDDDRLGSAANDDPTERLLCRLIDLPVHEPRGDVQKIPFACRRGMLPSLAPLNK